MSNNEQNGEEEVKGEDEILNDEDGSQDYYEINRDFRPSSAPMLSNVASKRVHVNQEGPRVDADNRIYPFQQKVATEILDKVRSHFLTLRGEDDLSKLFNHVEYLIVVPSLKSLTKQTQDRLSMMRFGTDPKKCVVGVGRVDSKETKNIVNDFRERIESENKTLFVLIRDECHYAPTSKGCTNEMLIDEELNGKENFITLLVSATPYNNLSNDTRILDDHIINWGKIENSGEEKPTFVSHQVILEALENPSSSLVRKDERSIPVKLKIKTNSERGYKLVADYCFSLLCRILNFKMTMGGDGNRVVLSNNTFDISEEEIINSSLFENGADQSFYKNFRDLYLSCLDFEEPDEIDDDEIDDDENDEFLDFVRRERLYDTNDDMNQTAKLKQNFENILEEHLGPKENSEEQDRELLGILKRKRNGEKNQFSSEYLSYFNETDKIIKQLLHSQKSKPLIIMRVYTIDENMIIQYTLRNALFKFGLTRRELQKNGRIVSPFSVLGDNGDDKNLVHNIEPYYLEDYKINGSITLRERIEDEEQISNIRSNTVELVGKFNQLQDIPMLMILCNKGRMGDTFSHSFSLFDLRIRTASDHFTTFKQEMGRLCRYPEFCDEKLEEYNLYPEIDDDVIIDPSQYPKHFGEFEDGIFKRFICSNFDLENGTTMDGEDEKDEKDEKEVYYKQLKYRIPSALIECGVHTKLLEASERCQTNNDLIIKNVILTKFDKYLQGGGMERLRQDHYRYNPHKNHQDFIDNEGSTKPCQFSSRFLLQAEEQIGKTGVYLHFLGILFQKINQNLLGRNCSMEFNDQDVDFTNSDSDSLLQFEMREQIPYWKNICSNNQDKLNYSIPNSGGIRGKYTIKLLKQRACLIMKLINEFPNMRIKEFIDMFQMEVENSEYPLSRLASGFLQALNNVGDLYSEIDLNSMEEMQYLALRSCLNWDDRMNPRLNESGQGEYLKAILDEKKEEPLNDRNFEALIRFLKDNEGYNLQSDVFEKRNSLSCRKEPSSLESDQPLNTFYLSESNNLPYKLEFQECYDDDLGYSERENKRQPWVFIPSFGRSEDGKLSILSYVDVNIQNTKNHTYVLVVRQDDFEAYHMKYEQFKFLVLPNWMKFTFGRNGEYDLYPNVNGIGYSRLFIQAWAYHHNLDFVWMLDDNINKVVDLFPNNPNSSTNTTFGDVMTQLESIVIREDEGFISFPDHEAWKSRILRNSLSNNNNSDTIGDGKSLESFSGPVEQYAVIGIDRASDWRNDRIKKHFIITHSIYSFFLLNVKSTVERQVLFPPKSCWEDIDFMIHADDASLVVCKSTRFSHDKINCQEVVRNSSSHKRLFSFIGDSSLKRDVMRELNLQSIRTFKNEDKLDDFITKVVIIGMKFQPNFDQKVEYLKHNLINYRGEQNIELEFSSLCNLIEDEKRELNEFLSSNSGYIGEEEEEKEESNVKKRELNEFLSSNSGSIGEEEEEKEESNVKKRELDEFFSSNSGSIGEEERGNGEPDGKKRRTDQDDPLTQNGNISPILIDDGSNPFLDSIKGELNDLIKLVEEYVESHVGSSTDMTEGRMIDQMKISLAQTKHLKNIIKIYPMNLLDWSKKQIYFGDIVDADEEVLGHRFHMFPTYHKKDESNSFLLTTLNWAFYQREKFMTFNFLQGGGMRWNEKYFVRSKLINASTRKNITNDIGKSEKEIYISTLRKLIDSSDGPLHIYATHLEATCSSGLEEFNTDGIIFIDDSEDETTQISTEFSNSSQQFLKGDIEDDQW